MLTKRLKTLPLLGLLSLFVLFGNGCSILKSRNQSKSKQTASEDDKLNYKYALVEAAKQEMLGNYKQAIALYTECIDINPKSAVARYKMANLLINQKDYEGALHLLEQAVGLEPDNLWYKHTLANLYQSLEMFGQAIELYVLLIDEYPQRYDIYYDLAATFSRAKRYKDALDVYDVLEKRRGVHESISFAKNNIFIKLEQFNKVEKELKKLIRFYPDEIQYYSMLADYYLANKMDEKAYEVYQQILELEPDNSYVQLQLANYYKIQGDSTKSFEKIKNVFADKDVELETKVKLFVSNYLNKPQSDTDDNKIYELVNILMETHPSQPEPYTLYADILIRENQLDAAREQLLIVLEIEQNNYEIWEQLLVIDHEINDFAALFEHSQMALDYFPNRPRLYLYHGIAALQEKKPDDAVFALSTGKDLVIDNDALLNDFYYYLAEAYQAAGEYDKSEQTFEKLLEIDPNNLAALNNYSYYLAIRDKNLSKAKEMIERVLREQSRNPVYLDTHAWVLYKMEKYEKAKETIEKALQLGGNRQASIVEHYGDILYQLNQQEEAVEQWKKAEKLGNGSAHLKEKIESGKLIE